MKTFFKKQEQPQKKAMQQKPRIFYINDRDRNSLGPKMELNYISTTKYTLWNFLPLSLML